MGGSQCTLLGPEESGHVAPPWCGADAGPGLLWWGPPFPIPVMVVSLLWVLRWCLVGVVGGVWSLFENCIVDASIFIFVVKLVRAHGGCLGTRSR